MNIFEYKKSDFPEEITEILCLGKTVRIERIVSNGQASPPNFWYDQDEDEWVLLLQGTAELTFENEERTTLKTGDYLFIPAHRKHRVEKTSSEPMCIWLCVFGNNFTI